MRWSAVALALLLAGCSVPEPVEDDPVPPPAATWLDLPQAVADPLAPGPMSFTTADYDLGNVTVGGPDGAHEGYEYDARIRGTVTMPDGPGPFPFAVFLHGQHGTGTDAQPYRNDQGYVYLMEHLASHGVAVASILAHEINNRNGSPDTGMWARGELTLATIDAFAASPQGPRLDLTRIGLMGHSRGGEGVVTAAEVNAERAVPHDLSAIVALAPTDFAYRAVPGIPFLTLAPYCDGDVYSLHGLRQFDQSRYADDAAVKVQVLVMGANHNNYNTMWGRGHTGPVTSQGDDAPFGRHLTMHCDLRREEGGGRLTLEETYAESILHLGGFLRWTLLGDDGLAGYFLGAPQPPAACPAQAACPGAVLLSTMTPGRVDVFHVEQSGVVAAPGVQATFAPNGAPCRMDDCSGNTYSSAWMANVQLLPPTATASLDLTLAPPLDVRHAPVFNVRIGVPTDGGVNSLGPPAMAVTFHDAAGLVRVDVEHPALSVPPGNPVEPQAGVPASGLAPGTGKVSANAVAIRVPAGVDAGNLTAIVIEFTGAGPDAPLPDRILVADAWFNRDTASATAPQTT